MLGVGGSNGVVESCCAASELEAVCVSAGTGESCDAGCRVE